MNKIINQIERIREINNQHKLVIFVGAGVSRNSGICSWWELVRDIAIKISYNDICEKCQEKYNYYSECGTRSEFCDSNVNNCWWKYNFSSDEFLKIPQYFYDTFGKDLYYQFITSKFSGNFLPNEIDNVIIALNPEHIITTNYDHLIEDVKLPNISNYAIIKDEDDILKKYGSHYIIKMHGDIDQIEKIVLKEDDYLNYTKNHELIETYIKSLLIDKTFLFLGYSLNDNNLSLIMSYIDYFAKDKEINRSPHYLVTSDITNRERTEKYWKNKNVELVDLSQINDTMKECTNCESLYSEQGKLLYTFLKYIKDDKLPYSKNRLTALKKSLLKMADSFNSFNYVSYTTLLKLCNFSNPVENINGSIHFFDQGDFEIMKSIFEQGDDDSDKIKKSFLKAGVHSIQCNNRAQGFLNYHICDSIIEYDKLFVLSLENNYYAIDEQLKNYPDSLEKAYYYSLIYGCDSKACQKIMEKIKKEIDAISYTDLSEENKYKIAVYEYNLISLRLLKFEKNNREHWDRLEELLENASTQNKAFEYIKLLCGNNGEMINKLNEHLRSHEDYYMKKSTLTKWGGTIYGDLFKMQCVVYDYYIFYKKNHLMLDYFNNVEKMCEPYIKSILCTYYPDDYQYSKSDFGRTQVEPYPLTIIDIDMIVKHTKLKNFNNWILHYKVFSIKVDEEVDIVTIFQNFCKSMQNYLQLNSIEQMKVFIRLISLIELTVEQKQEILINLIDLVKPEKEDSVIMLRDNLSSIWSFVQSHYNKESNYRVLLKLLLNKKLVKKILDGKSAYENLIIKLLSYTDEEIYEACVGIVNDCETQEEKSRFVFLYHEILFIYNYSYWHKWILDNINYCKVEDVYQYLVTNVIVFDGVVKAYFDNKLKIIDRNNFNGVLVRPDNKAHIINCLIVLLLTGHIKCLEDIKFIERYKNEYSYIWFLLDPETFDYSKITTADYMWCNIINNTNFREMILSHKKDFWTEDDEKRISFGFGSNFENRVAYKYLFD